MRDFIILVVIVTFSLVTYYLVEPFAHSQMHAHVDSKHFKYADITPMTKTGDIAKGKELVTGAAACTGCHSIESEGMPAMMDALTAAQSYGVNPPDLSKAGAVYDTNFLADLVKNPTHALALEHKYPAGGDKMYPMTQFYGAGGDIDQETADIVAYLVSIAPKAEELTDKDAFEVACGRCHSMKYKRWTQIGEKKVYTNKMEELRFDANVLDYQGHLVKYLGALPPDLSMYYLSRGHHFLETFVEDPESHLPGTAMPRVGVSAESAEKLLAYMQDAADPHAKERNALGINVMIYMIFFILAAFLWKRQVWKKLH